MTQTDTHASPEAMCEHVPQTTDALMPVRKGEGEPCPFHHSQLNHPKTNLIFALKDNMIPDMGKKEENMQNKD